MNKKYILFFLFGLLSITISAQSLAEAKALYEKGEYEEAKPTFKKLVKTQPGNGNYNLWYGVCCLETGEPAEALKYLESAVKRRVPSGQLYLALAYNDLYRFEDAIETYETYISDLKKRKRSTEEAEQLLEKSKSNLRMLKGVEEVCFIDSFVVDKEKFLDAYKISPESGKLFMYDTYFNDSGKEGGTVYETELGNKLYYSEMQPDSTLSILSRNKLLDKWSDGSLLPGSINEAMNADYPYVLTDGITIYYASDGPGSMGGYDIFVTRYNTNTDSYLMPENVGMPFNSPYNDYMYVIDEFNDLGWFASDRYQPEGKVCIYVFIPNSSKQVYNYEGMDPDKMISLAQLHSIKDTWTDTDAVKGAEKGFGLLPTQSRGLPRSMISNSSLTTTPPTTSWTISAPHRPKPRMANTISWSRATNNCRRNWKICVRNTPEPTSRKRTRCPPPSSTWSNVYGNCPLRWSRLPFKCATWKNKPPNKDNYGYTHYRLIDYRSSNLVLSGIIRNSGHQRCRFSGRRLHHLCQLLCLCLYGHHGRCHYAYHICPGLYRLVGMVHALQDTRQNCIEKNITSKVDRSAEEKVKVGDIGVTTTRLALIGYAEINGDIVEVKSSDGFLNEKTPIIVDRIADGVLLVERLKQ